MERMSNAINVRVEELREHLKKYYDETIYLETRLDRAKRDNEKLEKENKWLWEENKNLRDYADNLDSENDNQAIEIEELKKENKELKETIKDHQLYEKKLEHRIIEFEELLH
jgi:chromosome segregation ATPase